MRRLLPVIVLLLLFSQSMLGQNQTVANGSATTAIILQGSGCYYTWRSDKDIGLTYPTIGPSTGNIPSFIAVNTTNQAITARITATPIVVPPNAFIANPLRASVTITETEPQEIGKQSVLTNIVANAYGVAATLDGTRILVSGESSNNVAVIRNSPNSSQITKVIATIPVGTKPRGVAISPDGKTAYVACSGSEDIWIIDLAKSAVTGSFHVGGELTGIAISPDGKRKYVTQKDFNTVAVLDENNQVIRNVGVGPAPTGIAVSPDGTRVYVANNGGNTVSIINTTLASFPVTTASVGNSPFGVVASHDGTKIYVTNSADNTVSCIGPTGTRLVAPIPVGHNPIGISITGDDSQVVVANYDDDEGNVSVIHTADNSVVPVTTYQGQGNFSFGNFIPGGISCSAGPVVFNITVTPTPPSITATGPLAALTTSEGVPSASTSFTFTSLSLPSGVVVSPPAGFEVSTDNITFSSSVTVGTSGNISGKVYVRLAAGAPAGNYTGDITLSSGSTSTTIPVAPSSVAPARPVILTGPVTGVITACRGAIATNYQQFTISGVALDDAVTIYSADNNFEVSLTPTDVGFSHSIQVTGIPTLAPTTIYVRSTALAPEGDQVPGTIFLTSSSATAQRVNVVARVFKVPVANAVSSQVLVNGDNTAAVHFTGMGSNTFIWTTDHPEIGFPDANGTGDIPAFKAINNGTSPIIANVTAYPVSTGLTYISNLGLNSVAVINNADNKLIASIGVGTSPKSMIINKDATRIFVANSGENDISVINMGDNSVIATIPVGHNPMGMSFNADETQLSVYNSEDGTVSVIRVSDNTVISTGNFTGYAPGTIISPDGKRAYLFDGMSSFYVYDTQTNQHVATLGATSFNGLTLSPDGNTVYMSDYGLDKVQVYDATNNYALINSIDVGSYPLGVTLSQDGTQLYVANEYDNTVSIVNLVTFDITTLSSPGNIFTPNTAINTGGTGCSGLPAQFTIKVNPTPPTIVATGTVAPLFTTAGVASPAASFSLSAINLIQGIQIDAPTGFEVSVDGHTFSGNLLVGGAGNMSPIPVYVRLAATMPVGIYNTGYAIRLSSSPANDVYVQLNGEVASPVPTVTGTVATGTINACVGSASEAPNLQQFTVSGFLLTTDATATASAGFEVSTDGINYAGSVTIPQSGGNIAGTVVYVRSSASAAVGSPHGTVTLDGGNIQRFINVNAVIHPPPTVNQLPEQTVNNGQVLNINFDGTGNSYSWHIDNDAIGLLPADGNGNISFTAVNHTISDITAQVTVTPHSASLAYIAGAAFVYVADLASNTLVNKIPLGGGGIVPYAITVSPDGRYVYVVNQNASTVSVISTSSNTVTDVIHLRSNSNPAGVALSPDGSFLYVTNRGWNDVSVINTATKTELPTRIVVGNGPEGIAVSPDGTRIYVANQGAATVSVIDADLKQEISKFTVGGRPEGVAVAPDGGKVYITNYSGGSGTNYSFAVYDTHHNTVSPVTVGGINPSGVAITPDGGTMYITNSGSNTISVINTADNTLRTSIHPTNSVSNSPKGISVSPDGLTVYVANYLSNCVTVIDTRTNTVVTTLTNIISPISYGNFITSGSGCEGIPMTFSIIVKASLTNITVSGAPSAINTTYGTPSVSTGFSVAGINMSAGILVTPPAGFEVSKDNTAFSPTVNIGAAGTIAATPVYIRLAAATPVGPYAGDIKLSSAADDPKNVPMPESTVSPAPLTITADNKTRITGVANPVLTASYTGFVNLEGPAQLTAQAVLATAADMNSPVGQYPITITGATSPNYMIDLVPGTLTINAAPAYLTVSNTFTPNGDGINDTWVIKDIDTYPNCTVAVFNRNGQRVFFSNNYPVPWDGRFNGKDLPSGTYYYIITPGNGFKALTGYIAIIR